MMELWKHNALYKLKAKEVYYNNEKKKAFKLPYHFRFGTNLHE